MTQRPHAAVFLVRAWWEDGQFRARISYSLGTDSTAQEQMRVVTAKPEEVRYHLAKWLREAAPESEG